MKIVHSFWSKPSFHGNQNYENSRKFGGWLSYKYFLLSTCFSCLTLRKHHGQVDFYSDSKGEEVFIKQLDLPYSNVSTVLNELEGEDHRLWVLGKLKVIKLQTKPFIHVDNDVFIWESLPINMLSNSLLAQSKHLLPSAYKSNLKGVFDNFNHIPKCLAKVPTNSTTIANIGIIGGTNIDFFQEYCETAYKFLNENLENLPKINIGGFNQIMDEYLFTCLANELEHDVRFFINNTQCDNPNIDPYQHVLRFHLVPLIDKYIHVVGTAKQNAYACEQLELRLKYQFPEYYKRISEAIRNFYPDLMAIDSYESIRNRERQVYKAISVISTHNIEEISKMKFQLIDDLVLLESKDEHGISYSARTMNLITGEESYEKLHGSDTILAYFNSPVSINELLEIFENDYGLVEQNEFQQLKENVISTVLEKFVISNQLKLV